MTAARFIPGAISLSSSSHFVPAELEQRKSGDVAGQSAGDDPRDAQRAANEGDFVGRVHLRNTVAIIAGRSVAIFAPAGRVCARCGRREITSKASERAFKQKST
jgi:hypothetical protein